MPIVLWLMLAVAAPLKVDFTADAPGSAPAGFTAALTGQGQPGEWKVVDNAGNHVLAQTSDDATDSRFPVCVLDGFEGKDVDVSVRFKALSGKVDQAAGIVVRYRDKDNYYVARANALEDNVRLYHVIDGKRTQFAGEKIKVTPGEWHILRLVCGGQRFVVHYDGKELFAADDGKIEQGGKVGLWTKADSVTWFDDLAVETAP